MPRPLVSRRAALAASLAAALVGCVGTLARLPEVAPDARREAVEPRASSCSGDACAHTVRVGDRTLDVRARTRVRSPDALGGRTMGSVVRGAASAMAGAVARRHGFATTAVAVGLGERTVADPAGTLRLRCAVAWIDETTHERVRDEERGSTMRLAEGWRCDAAERGDTTAVRWTLRGGIAPEADSVAALVGMLDRGEVGTAALDRPLALARVDAADAPGYAVTRDEGDGARTGPLDLRAERWVLRRADGTLVGLVHHSALPRTALDLAPDATPAEVELLRLLAATIAIPLR